MDPKRGQPRTLPPGDPLRAAIFCILGALSGLALSLLSWGASPIYVIIGAVIGLIASFAKPKAPPAS